MNNGKAMTPAGIPVHAGDMEERGYRYSNIFEHVKMPDEWRDSASARATLQIEGDMQGRDN